MVIVIHPPSIQNVSRLSQAQEQFAIQTLIPQLAIKAFHVSILPRTARLDEQCSDLRFLEPLLHGLGRELWAVITADVSWPAADREQLR